MSLAKNDPIGFIEGLQKPTILDEVQRVPEIFLSIKQDVDHNRKPGRYALTGSANPLLIPQLGDSLAGRMSTLELYPLSQGELRDIFDDFISLVFSDRRPPIETISRKILIDLMMRGGYPNVQMLDTEKRDMWFSDYLSTILTREITDLAKIEGIVELPNLLRILATRSSNMLNISDISQSIGLPNTTLRRYFALLQTIFMVSLLPPWSENIGKRLVTTPKVFLTDTGLLCYLQGINHERFLVDPVLLGAVIESFIDGA